MYIRLIQKAVITPLNTAFLMEYLRAPAEDESLVKKLALRAQEAFVKFTNGNTVSETEYEVTYDTIEYYNSTTIELPHRPILSIKSVVYYTADNQEVAIDPSEYLHLPGDYRVIRPGMWNTDNPRPLGSLKINYVAGRSFGAVDDDILAGIEQYVTYLYENRGDTSNTLPDSVATLWAPFVIYRF